MSTNTDIKKRPPGSSQKLYLYVLDGQPEQLDLSSIKVKLEGTLHDDHIYGTVREGRVYRTSKNSQDNRRAHYFAMEDAEDYLKITREMLRNDILKWVEILESLEVPSRIPSPSAEEATSSSRNWTWAQEIAAVKESLRRFRYHDESYSMLRI